MFLLDSRISPDQKEAVARVQQAAQAHDLNLYLAGGAVRDLITGMPIRDFDFVVEGNALRMGRDLEKAGARLIEESEKYRHIEFLMPGDVECSVGSTRDDVYEHPGAKPEIRWCTVTEDLRRRDFSLNAVALSLTPASRGLLLDPTNGLADLDLNHEVRALSIHSFTNQPERLLRAVRYSVRMGFKIEARTADWFALAKERRLHEQIPDDAVGREVRQLAGEEKVVNILKGWESHGLIGAIHEKLVRRHPDYDGLARLCRARESMLSTNIRVSAEGAFAPTVFYVLGRLGSREQSGTVSRMHFRKAENEVIHTLTDRAEKVIKALKGPAKNLLPKNLDRKLRTKALEARAVYNFLEKTPPGLLAFILAEYSAPKAINTIRMYVAKWKPLRGELPVAELETMGMARGPKFEQVMEDLFNLQLTGKGRNPQDRTKLLRRLSGIKAEPPKREKKEEKKGKGSKLKKGTEAPPPAPSKPLGKAVPAPAPAKPATKTPPVKPKHKPTPPARKPAARKKKSGR
jgi:tRNA nucleotidyltransferase/poly(A) polymerase